jgi:hypothetical protein
MKSANICSSLFGSSARPSASIARKHQIEGVDQVGRGVDQRAVEVENDGRGGHGRIASLSWRTIQG